MRNIEIYWTYPRDYNNIGDHPLGDCLGIYYISRVWGGKETAIYVGKTLQAFKTRMYQHDLDGDDYTTKRGRLKIRLGTIPQSFNFGRLNKDHFILTLESAIIQNIKDKSGVNLCNKQQLIQSSYYYGLQTRSTGFQAVIDREILIERNK